MIRPIRPAGAINEIDAAIEMSTAAIGKHRHAADENSTEVTGLLDLLERVRRMTNCNRPRGY